MIIEWSEERLFVVVCLYHIFVNCKYGVELFHENRDIQHGLRMGLHIIDGEKMVEGWEMLQIVLDESWKGFC